MKPKSTKLINQNEINHVATEPLSCPPLETLPNKNSAEQKQSSGLFL